MGKQDIGSEGPVPRERTEPSEQQASSDGGTASLEGLGSTSLSDLRQASGSSLDASKVVDAKFGTPEFTGLLVADAGTPLDSQKLLADMQQFAQRENLSFRTLDSAGIPGIESAWQQIREKCPKDGSVVDNVSGGQRTGMTTVGADGRRVPTVTGATHDRYFFKKEDGFFYHVRSVDTMGVPPQFERAGQTAGGNKIYVYQEGQESRVAVILPDGKSAYQVNMRPDQVNKMLEELKRQEKQQQKPQGTPG